jgi:hypothetical protein
MGHPGTLPFCVSHFHECDHPMIRLSFRAPYSARSASVSASSGGVEENLGSLPEWNLTDLYPSMDSAELQADFAQVETETKSFAERYKGKPLMIAWGVFCLMRG